MPRKRIKNTDLPRNWQMNHGAYYFVVPVAQRELFTDRATGRGRRWIKLGRTLADAHRTYAEEILPLLPGQRLPGAMVNVNDLCDRYEVEVLPLNAPGTQENKRRSLRLIRAAFGNWQIAAMKPKHVYEYYSWRRQSAERGARADVEVLRHLYTKAVEWGVIDRHPFKGEVRISKSAPRSRYVSDDELSLFKANYATEKIAAYLELKELTGLSKQDILCIKLEDIKEDGLHAHRRKTNAKPKVYCWDERGLLRRALEQIKAVHGRGHVGSLWLFHTRTGDRYYRIDSSGRATGKPSGFDSIWQRCMQRWKTDGHTPFTDHDIRAKVASDVELQHAQQLLDHTDPAVTDRVYRRAARVVKINTPNEK